MALLLALAERSRELGIVLHAAHLHHGLRGKEADEDLEFSRELAGSLGLPFHESRVDTAAEARRCHLPDKVANDDEKRSRTIEEAARLLRYRWFRKMMAEGTVDAVATAHTLDDQAETVLAKFLRGAWTEGLSGIHPILEFPEGCAIRPVLNATRSQVEAFLRARNQVWREDSSNRHLSFTRNRIRHELLPLLEGWNPRLREHLSQMAELARDEEAFWEAELARLAPQILVHGRPVRGGGRAASEGIAVDVRKLAAQPLALQRRLLRHAAAQLGAAPDFTATEALRNLALAGSAGQKCELTGGLRAERTHRELRLNTGPLTKSIEAPPDYEVSIPGEVEAPAFGIRIKIELSSAAKPSLQGKGTSPRATLRTWKAGDRVQLRYSSGPRKVKEILERMKVTGDARPSWPVLEHDGRIVWMRGVELETELGFQISEISLESDSGGH